MIVENLDPNNSSSTNSNGNLTNPVSVSSQSVTNDDARSRGSVNYKHVHIIEESSRGETNENEDSGQLPSSPTSPLLTDTLIKATITESPSPSPAVLVSSTHSSSGRQSESLSTSSSSSSLSTSSTSSPSQITSMDTGKISRGKQVVQDDHAEAKDDHNDTNVVLVLSASASGKSKRHTPDTGKETQESKEHQDHKISGSNCRKAVRRCLDKMPHSPLNELPPTVQSLNNSCR